MQYLNILQNYLETLKNKTYYSIFFDASTRVISLICFPFIFGLLVLFNFFYPIRIGFLYRVRLGHFIGNTEIYLRRRYLGETPKSFDIFFTYEPVNQQICNMFSRVIPIVQSEFLTKIFAPISIFQTRFNLPLPQDANEYRERILTPPPIAFTPEEKFLGTQKLNSMGISPSDWYVCIHARDNAFAASINTDAKYIISSDYRNADINTYNLAIEEILSRGGFVIRVGSVVEKPMEFIHPKVIDYPLKFRDDFSDVYITANAKFYIGPTNGNADLALLFDVPSLFVNTIPIGISPPGKNSIFIPKRIYDEKNTQIAYSEQLMFFQKLPFAASSNPIEEFKKHKWKLIDNTPTEIKNAVIEMFSRLDGSFIEESDYIKLLEHYHDLFDEENPFRHSKSPCAQSFLKTLNLN
jgi:putative glycosyltransferase (TIGR04372 family)